MTFVSPNGSRDIAVRSLVVTQFTGAIRSTSTVVTLKLF